MSKKNYKLEMKLFKTNQKLKTKTMGISVFFYQIYHLSWGYTEAKFAQSLSVLEMQNISFCSLKRTSFVLFLTQCKWAFKLGLYVQPGNTNWREKLSTVDLLALTSLDQLLIVYRLFTFLEKSYLN
jgi:hypothetical protein